MNRLFALILQSATCRRKRRHKLSKVDQLGAVGKRELMQWSSGLSKRVQSEEKWTKNHVSKCKADALTAAPIAQPNTATGPEDARVLKRGKFKCTERAPENEAQDLNFKKSRVIKNRSPPMQLNRLRALLFFPALCF